MALSIQKAIRSKFQNGRTQFCFKCIECDEEFWPKQPLSKSQSERCRPCASRNGTKITAAKLCKRPFESLYNSFIYNCKRNNKETDLTYEDFLCFTKDKNCCYCGILIPWFETSLSRTGYKYNLDRKDSSKGYFKNNIVVCCWSCNKVKSNILSYEEMKVAMEAIMEFRYLKLREHVRSGKKSNL